MSPNVARQEPPYLQIAEDIRRQIRTGELHDGDLVPSTRQLARDWYGVSADRLQGPGRAAGQRATSAAWWAPARSCARARPCITPAPTGCRRSRRRAGSIRRTSALSSRRRNWCRPRRPIADALGVAPGAQVIRRHRVTLRNDAPQIRLNLMAARRAGRGRPAAADHRADPRTGPSGTSSKSRAALLLRALTRTPPGRRPSRTPPTWASRPAPR